MHDDFEQEELNYAQLLKSSKLLHKEHGVCWFISEVIHGYLLWLDNGSQMKIGYFSEIENAKKYVYENISYFWLLVE